MGDIAVRSKASVCNITISLTTSRKVNFAGGGRTLPATLRRHPTKPERKSVPPALIAKNQAARPAATYSTRIVTASDIPLRESLGATFDDYLDDKPRAFRAMLDGNRRSGQLSEEEWRIKMSPMQVLLLTAWPVVDVKMTCKSEGIDYPAGIAPEITRVVELEMTRWRLQGIDGIMKQSEFSLGVKAALYPDRRGGRSMLRGQVESTVSLVLPPVLAVVPRHVLGGVLEAEMKKVVKEMMQTAHTGLLADYDRFKKEKKLKAAAAPLS
ncbi:hypothetical protein NMG60_11028445 [Bertholletia excelsa]